MIQNLLELAEVCHSPRRLELSQWSWGFSAGAV